MFVGLVIHPDEAVGVISSSLGFPEYSVADGGGYLRGAGEYPEILAGTAAHESIAIVGGEHEDAVVGIEETEEGYPQETWSLGQFGFALGCFPVAILDATIDNADAAILVQCVSGGAVSQATLKSVVIACYLVPHSQIAIEVNRSDWGVVHLG